MDELARSHAEMRAFVLDSMPPGYYDMLTQLQKDIIDVVIGNCFRWHRSKIFQQFPDQIGGALAQSESEQFGTESD